jgi:glucose-6-phosphate isomerase
MLPRINPTSTQAWFVLQKHYEEEMNRRHMRDLFASDPDRFKKFSITLGDILFDYSKNIINEKTLKLLLQLAEDCNVKQAIAEQFAGVPINETENRAVLHTALRSFDPSPILVDGADIKPGIQKVRAQMEAFCAAIHSGSHKGYTGKKIK